jgi:GT2 family glycosyltransferase
VPTQREERPALSIVIVNSDGAAYTIGCLEAIYRLPPVEPFEIVLVDNCSAEPCLPLVRERFPHVRLLSAPERQGFAKNNNLGIRHARGEYILLLNNDTEVQPGALQTLLDAARAHPEYAMIGPKLLWPSGRVQHFCAYPLPTVGSYVANYLLTDPGLPLGRLWTRLLEWRAGRRKSGPVEAICGAAAMISRAALEAVGPLDEGYHFYYEDLEWCYRVWQSGRVVAYIAEARIVHFGGRSSSKVRVWAKQNEYHSALRYFRQCRRITPREEQTIWLAAVVGFFFRAVGYLLAEALTGKQSHARATLYVWQWLLRRPTQAARGISGEAG